MEGLKALLAMKRARRDDLSRNYIRTEEVNSIPLRRGEYRAARRPDEVAKSAQSGIKRAEAAAKRKSAPPGKGDGTDPYGAKLNPCAALAFLQAPSQNPRINLAQWRTPGPPVSGVRSTNASRTTYSQALAGLRLVLQIFAST